MYGIHFVYTKNMLYDIGHSAGNKETMKSKDQRIFDIEHNTFNLHTPSDNKQKDRQNRWMSH